MDIREHHLGRISMQLEDGIVAVDASAPVRRLVLFERVAVESIRLTELPTLAALFGWDTRNTLGIMQQLKPELAAGHQQH